jgi:hypothetical protein
MTSHNTFNRRLMWLLFAVLVVLHYDFWFWSSDSLLFDFLPVGLAYQILISLAASALWGWAAFCAWPAELEKVVHPDAPASHH